MWRVFEEISGSTLGHAPTAAELELRLLGSVLIKRRGHPIHFTRRKALALVAYLASIHRAETRASLAGLFWP